MSTMLSLLAAAPAVVPSMPEIDAGGELLRVVFSLVGIIVLIFGASWLTRRLQGRQLVGGRRLRCLETMPVGTRERVLLIDADGKRLLIGVGVGGVRTLHVYEGAEPVVAMTPPAAPPFSDLLGRLGRRS